MPGAGPIVCDVSRTGNRAVLAFGCADAYQAIAIVNSAALALSSGQMLVVHFEDGGFVASPAAPRDTARPRRRVSLVREFEVASACREQYSSRSGAATLKWAAFWFALTFGWAAACTGVAVLGISLLHRISF